MAADLLRPGERLVVINWTINEGIMGNTTGSYLLAATCEDPLTACAAASRDYLRAMTAMGEPFAYCFNWGDFPLFVNDTLLAPHGLRWIDENDQVMIFSVDHDEELASLHETRPNDATT